MLPMLADENFNNNIIRGVLRRKPNADIIRVQDIGLSGADDPRVLEKAAQENRVLLTHDVSTITKYAYERLEAGQSMSGVFEVSRTAPIGSVIEDIVLLIECSLENEWAGQIIYLPLK
ncbi:MAG: DUF5615 family PIN-like protein [Anaerolineae bacterium]|nr:DUF5615 family PIN-like protein [Anaerolineae bacterium]